MGFNCGFSFIPRFYNDLSDEENFKKYLVASSYLGYVKNSWAKEHYKTFEDYISLLAVNIKDDSKQEKFIKIPQQFLKLILSYKRNPKNYNLNFDNSIFEYCKEIRKEKEIDIKKEHKKITENELEHTDKAIIEKKPTANLNKTIK